MQVRNPGPIEQAITWRFQVRLRIEIKHHRSTGFIVASDSLLRYDRSLVAECRF